MENFIIYGLGKSGLSTIKHLANNFKNNEIIGTDDNNSALENNELKALEKKFSNVKFLPANEIKFSKNSKIIFAPGIPLYFPKTHKILNICQTNNCDLICDIELFYRQNYLNNDFIGITGTNGKSTTTALINFVLKYLNIDCEAGGNIGVPCFDLPIKQKFCYVFETSSFQLDLMSQTKFSIANLINITPDHLDRHGSMANYIDSKKRIFANQDHHDFSIINIDDEISLKIFLELKNKSTFKSQLVSISTSQIPNKINDFGVSVINGILYNNIFSANLSLQINSQFLRGKHNDQNIAFAFASVFCYYYKKFKNDFNFLEISQKIIDTIEKFKGLKHRLQIVKKTSDICFINDSKATNADSTQNALKAFDNIFWILGGKPKDGGITSLKPYFKKIIKAYLIGEASDEFAKILTENNVNFEKCYDLKTAFSKSLFDAKNNSLSEKNILLSPACASFDQFKNFEERGDCFCKLVDDNIL